MANSNPPKKNQAFLTGICLRDANDNLSLKANPTIAEGDFQISKDFGAFANLTNIPTVAPASGVQVKLDLTATEMNADNIIIRWVDQTTIKEWADGWLEINTTA